MSEHEQLLGIYQTYVETISNNEAKRLQANATYSGFLIALVSVAFAIESSNILIFSTLGLVVSVIWFFTILYHRDLAASKFHVLTELEKRLPFQAFEIEWTTFMSKKRKLTLTQFELLLPIASGVVCSIPLGFTIGHWIWDVGATQI